MIEPTIEHTLPLIWAISFPDHTPAGNVDLEPDGRYVAIRSAEIIDICDTLEEAAQSLMSCNVY